MTIFSNKVKTINGLTPQEWISETEELILNSKNITILKNTLVTTYKFTNHLIAKEDKFDGKKIMHFSDQYIMCFNLKCFESFRDMGEKITWDDSQFYWDSLGHKFRHHLSCGFQ